MYKYLYVFLISMLQFWKSALIIAAEYVKKNSIDMAWNIDNWTHYNQPARLLWCLKLQHNMMYQAHYFQQLPYST